MAKPKREKETETWTIDEVEAFLQATSWHRWAIPFRLNVLYGLRRSEQLAPKWDDFDDEAGTLRIDETLRVLTRRRAEQATERLAAGTEWVDNDLRIATRQGGLVPLRADDRALERLVQRAELPTLTSHGLRVAWSRIRRRLLSRVAASPTRQLILVDHPCVDP